MVVDLLVPERDGRSLVACGVIPTTVGRTRGHVVVNKRQLRALRRRGVAVTPVTGTVG